MTSENRYLYEKIVDYLANLKTEHIMSASVIYQGLEENPWVSKDELKEIVEQANGTSKLQQELVKILNEIPISELTWDNPLASQ
ncbi:12320_t:CDS:2, partial [Racocetra fulgida]